MTPGAWAWLAKIDAMSIFDEADLAAAMVTRDAVAKIVDERVEAGIEDELDIRIEDEVEEAVRNARNEELADADEKDLIAELASRIGESEAELDRVIAALRAGCAHEA